MRVGLILEQALGPVPGGTGRYAVQLAAALAARDGVEVAGWTAWHRDTAAARVAGVGGPRRLPLPRRALTAAWQLGLGPAPRGIDVLHAPTLLFPPRRSRPLVVTIHDAVPWTHPETLTPRGVRWHRDMAERATALADAIVVPSRVTADALGRELPLRRAPDVVPLGVTALPLPGDAAERAARLGLPPDGYLLSLATLEPRKGLDVLLRALALPGGPDLPLVLVGSPGWGDVRPAALAAELGLAEGRVRSLGRLADDDLAVALARASALVVPSRAEGFGLPVLEGMAAGVPVVTSSDPALLDVGAGAVVASDTGDPASLAAALRRVCGEPDLRDRLVAAGRDRAAAFTWAACAEAHAAVYARVAEGGTASSSRPRR